MRKDKKAFQAHIRALPPVIAAVTKNCRKNRAKAIAYAIQWAKDNK